MYYLIGTLGLTCITLGLLSLQYYMKSKTSDPELGLNYLGKSALYFRALEIFVNISLATVFINTAIEVFIWSQKVINLLGYNPFIPLLVAFLCLIIGMMAYSVRCRFRMHYGIIEIAIGIVATYRTVGAYDANAIIQVAAGIYIIVRGLDNIEKAIKKNPEFRKKWVRLFGSPD